MNGYWKRILRVDLTTRKTSVEEIPEELIFQYRGAKGLGAYYLINESRENTDPLSPDNKIILSTGPFQGTGIVTSGRYAAVTKSPLTGLFLDSYSGGTFGHKLKKSGFDLLLIEGKADTPVYISIDSQRREVLNASDIWGRTTLETEETLKKRHGKASSVVSIGPAGENRVLFACLICDRRRAAGRGGTGAVFGSKNLKAVIVSGSTEVPVADHSAILHLNRQAAQLALERRKNKDSFFIYGTSSAFAYANQKDRVPTLNFKKGEWEYGKGLEGRTIHNENRVKFDPCCACPTACGGIIESNGKDRPEYETLAMLGANCGIKNYETVVEANRLCNLFGLDTISTGNVIGFAMECSEKGIIEEKLPFGDAEKLLSVIKDIALKQGLGELLSQGTRRLAEKWGRGSSVFAMQVKGLELPAWNSRGKLGQGLAYMTADIGGSHLRDGLSEWEPPLRSSREIVRELIETQNAITARDNYIICAFALFSIPQEFCLEYYKAVTGFEMNNATIQEVGERIYCLTRAFNCRNGITIKDDDLPARDKYEGLPSGKAKGCTAFINDQDQSDSLMKYYELRGWDKEGAPRPETLKRLGIAL